jgi:CheY-like chemotaxis protein
VIKDNEAVASPKLLDKVAAPPSLKPQITANQLLQHAMTQKRLARVDLKQTPAADVAYEPAAKGPPHCKTILVIEDDDDTRGLLIRVLGTEYTVYAAVSGNIALEMLRKIPLPDLVLTDIILPGIDGHALAKMLKADPALCSIPLVFLSGGGAMDVVQAINLGARQYISKPFNSRDLLKKVKNIVK